MQSTGSLIVIEFCFATILSSIGSCYRAEAFWVEREWLNNTAFLSVLCVNFLVVLGLLFILADFSSMGVAGWLVFALWPFVNLTVAEFFFKRREVGVSERAALMRRLEFETRLGMWSPR